MSASYGWPVTATGFHRRASAWRRQARRRGVPARSALRALCPETSRGLMISWRDHRRVPSACGTSAATTAAVAGVSQPKDRARSSIRPESHGISRGRPASRSTSIDDLVEPGRLRKSATMASTRSAAKPCPEAAATVNSGQEAAEEGDGLRVSEDRADRAPGQAGHPGKCHESHKLLPEHVLDVRGRLRLEPGGHQARSTNAAMVRSPESSSMIRPCGPPGAWMTPGSRICA